MVIDDSHPLGAPRQALTPSELEKLATELNVPLEALESAVKEVGSDQTRIKDYLTGGAAAHQQDG